MSENPNKLSKFWQELKRRRVIHVITVYASAAFVIIELINNLAEPLNLPSNLLTIVVIILAVGFPLAIVLSWLYDLTSEGIEKTKALSEIREEEEKPKVPNAWRIATYVSFVVIAGLLTLNIVGGTKGLKAGDIQSLVVLPFNNYTGDDKLEYFVSGMHSALVGDMGKISGLRVISETSARAYKDRDMTATQIASELNVDGVIETSVLCVGDTVCIQYRLVKASGEEEQLYSGDIREEKSRILGLYHRITRKIADELMVNLTQQEETFLAESRIIDPEAYDAYLKGMSNLDLFSPESWSVAIESFEKAIEIEPDWAAPYAGLAEIGTYMNQFGIGSESDRLRMIYENLNKAFELNPNSAEAHHSNAVTAAWIEFDWKKAEMEFLKAIELNPSFARSHSFYAHVLTILRRTDEALYEGKLSVELDPENPFTLGLYVVVLVHAGQCQEALIYLEKALFLDLDHPFLRGKLGRIYECLGDYEKAFEENKKIHYDRWDRLGDAQLLEEISYEHGFMGYNQELARIYEEAMAKGIQVNPWFVYYKYFDLGKYDKAMDYLEIIYEENNHNPNLPYQSTKPIYDKMEGNARYIELLKKMNLPIN